MVPPRLTLVQTTPDDDRNRFGQHDAGEDHGAVDGARAALDYADPEAMVAHLSMAGQREKLRRLEALLFASSTPLDAKALARHLEDGDDVEALLTQLQSEYAERGVTIVRVAGKWQMRTAQDLGYLLQREVKEERRLSKAALETLSIIAYHQPVTRAEIEEVRGVQTSPGTLDVLMETGWIRPRGRRRAPGRPLTFGTTETFLTHFGLDTIRDLPGLSDLKAAGLLDANLPPGFTVPEPTDVAALMPDELPLTDDGDDEDAAGEGVEDDGQGELALPEDDEAVNPDIELEHNERDVG